MTRMLMKDLEYAGFWIRTGAALIDSVLMLFIIVPLLTIIYGQGYWGTHAYSLSFWNLVINYVLPAVAVVLFWIYKSATPGKIALKLTIVDAKTGEHPAKRQLIVRYLGYYLSMLPFFLGIFWVGIDKQKQGWHDKLSGTVVLRASNKVIVELER